MHGNSTYNRNVNAMTHIILCTLHIEPWFMAFYIPHDFSTNTYEETHEEDVRFMKSHTWFLMLLLPNYNLS